MARQRNYLLSTTFTAVDRLTRPLQRMQRSVQGFGSGVSLAFRGIANSTRQLEQSFDKIAGFAGIGGIAAGGAAFFGSEIAESTTKMQSFIDVAHQSPDTIKALASVVKPLGFDIETVTDLAEEMINKLGESSAMGEMTESTEDGLKMMGIRFKDIQKLAPEKQFKLIFDRLLSMEDASKAQAAADVLMGSEANRVTGALINQGKTLDQLIESTKKNNFLTQKGIDGSVKYTSSINKLKFVTDSLTRQFVGLIGKALAPTIDKYSELITANKELINVKMDKFISAFVDNIDNITSFTKVVGGSIIALGLFKGAAFAASFAAGAFGFGLSLLKAPILITIGFLKLLKIAFLRTAIAFVTNPFGVVIAGIILLVSIGALLITKWDEIKTVFSAFFGIIKDVGELIFDLITGDFESLLDFPDKISAKWSAITSTFSDVGKSISDLGNSAMNFMGFGDDDEITKKINIVPNIQTGGLEQGGAMIQNVDANTMISKSTTHTNIDRSELTIKDQTGKAELNRQSANVKLVHSGAM